MRVNGGERNPATLRLAVEVRDLPLGEPVRHQRLQRVHVLSARKAILEDLLLRPLGIFP